MFSNFAEIAGADSQEVFCFNSIDYLNFERKKKADSQENRDKEKIKRVRTPTRSSQKPELISQHT